MFPPYDVSRISVTSFLEHLSHNICRVIFWNFEMASATICRINICRITFKKYDPRKRYNTSSNRFTFFRDKCDVIFGTLSHNICRVIFWNFEMASASICRINICRITLIAKKKYDPCKALQYLFEPDCVYTVRINWGLRVDKSVVFTQLSQRELWRICFDILFKTLLTFREWFSLHKDVLLSTFKGILFKQTL
jgi:hypothetical protein